MSSNQPKTSQAIVGVRSLQTILFNIIKNPRAFKGDTELRLALNRQSTFSRLKRTLENDSGEIITTFPMSLNTLKTYADKELEGGFHELDNLRKKAKDAIDLSEIRESQVNKRSKSGLTRKVAQLELELELHRQTNTILVRALSAAMNSFNSIRDAEDRKLREKRTRDAQQLLTAIISLNMPPFNLLRDDFDNYATPSTAVTDINIYRQKP